MAEEEHTLTEYATNTDKSLRGKICYPFTQPLWWLVLPVRWVISRVAGAIFGDETRKWLWRKILTPANFLTAARFWLLGKAIALFFSGAALSEQTTLLFLAIITDFFDGPLARNNDEVTELGTYMDHVGDWSVILWVIFLNFRHQALPIPYLLISLGILPILFLIYIAKFREFYDHETSWFTNTSAFAAEELQTDFWGRLQFGFLAIAVFGGLFSASAGDPNFFFYGFTNFIPENTRAFLISACLALYFYLGGYSTREALNYSEAQAKKFREKLHKIKNGS